MWLLVDVCCCLIVVKGLGCALFVVCDVLSAVCGSRWRMSLVLVLVRVTVLVFVCLVLFVLFVVCGCSLVCAVVSFFDGGVAVCSHVCCCVSRSLWIGVCCGVLMYVVCGCGCCVLL